MLKRGRRHSVTGLWIALIALLSVAFAASTDRLTASEKRGKQIYLYGTSPSGREITAILGVLRQRRAGQPDGLRELSRFRRARKT